MTAKTVNKSLLGRAFRPTGGWKRRGISIAGALAVAGGIAIAEVKPKTAGLTVQSIEVTARPIRSFDKSRPELARFGRLEWRGGIELNSPSKHFGGWSGLIVTPDGARFAAVSDAGTWMTGRLARHGSDLTGIASAEIGPLLSRDGKVLSRGRDRDAEGVALLSGTLLKGEVAVSFEGNDRIGRFAIGENGVSAPSSYLPMPAALKKVKSFDGFEAVTVIQGGPSKGSIAGFTENPLPGQKDHAGWIWQGGAEPKPLSVTSIGGFSLTDAASLPDGSLLLLERRFRWSEGVKMRVRFFPAASIRPGARLDGEVLIEADLNQEIDNMEALAVHAGQNGETILTILSDDNFNPLLQRTLMLQFALPASEIAAR